MNINLEEKIIILYDFLYNNTLKKCYEINNINIKTIKNEDFIIMADSEDKKKEELVNKLLKEILSGQIQYFYEYDINFFFKRFTDQYSTIVKVSLHNNNNDSLISYLLSEFVVMNKTKHILLPILNIRVKTESILNSGLNVKKISETKKKFCNISIKEHFYKTYNLESYILEYKINWKIILFQIIHTLLVIKKTYPNFKHNMLNMKNIFVYYNDLFENKITTYNYNNKTYYIPNKEYEIKICNFDHSIIEDSNDEEEEYDAVEDSDDTQFISEKKESNDIVFLSNDILKNVKIDNETKDFLNRIKKYNLETILEDKYFLELMDKTEMKIDKPMTGIREIVTNYSLKLKKEDEYMFGDQKLLQNKVLKEDDSSEESNILSNLTNNENFRTLNLTNIFRKPSKSSIIVVPDIFKNIKGKRILFDVNTQITNLVGGSSTEFPMRNEKNTPFMSNDQRNTFKKKNNENPPPREPPVLLEQKIYDTNKNTQQRQEVPPAYIPVYNDANQVVAGLPTMVPNPAYTQQPFQKIYNISLANPIANMTTINQVYEDILPGDPSFLSFKSSYERIELIKWMRSLILDVGDGEDMTILAGKNSLLSFIKLLDFNPYSLSENLYKDLPMNFMLSRAAYPLRYDNKKNNLYAAKNSCGINVRLYNMTIAEYRAETFNKDITKFNFDLWREIEYYNYVKKNLIQAKVSPNFIANILYKIDKQSKINWQQLSNIQNKYTTDSSKQINKLHHLENLDEKSLNTIQNNKEVKITVVNLTLTLFNDLTKEFEKVRNVKVNYMNPTDPVAILKYYKDKTVIVEYDNEKRKSTNPTKDQIVNHINTHILRKNIMDITRSSGCTLILLTEAPTNTFIKWASPIYERNGSVKKMIATGYHSNEVWKSILFQIVYIFAVLEKHEIYFDELSLEKNFYIKDLFSESSDLKYWIYNIDDIDYYVPNYGYLVVFDSKYSDIYEEKTVPLSSLGSLKKSAPTPVPNDNKVKYKIYAKNIFENEIKFDEKSHVFNKFKEVINRITFGSKLKILGGNSPDDEIINIIGKISNTSMQSIKDCFKNNFSFFYHNRIGDILLKSEKEIINKLNKPDIKPGKILAYEYRYDEYYWALVIEDMGVTNKVKIYTKDNDKATPNLDFIEVYKYALYNYSENIIQNKISENNIIEKYIFTK